MLLSMPADHLLDQHDVRHAAVIAFLDQQGRHAEHEEHLEAEEQQHRRDEDDQPDHEPPVPSHSATTGLRRASRMENSRNA